MIPAWILDIFAAVMLAVAGAGGARLITTRAWSHPAADADIDVAHMVMGIAMAGMLAGGLRTLPNPAWAAIFTVVTAWFSWRVAAEAVHRRITALGGSHHLPHLVHAGAMVYMFLAVTGRAPGTVPAMGGMGAAHGGLGTLRLPALAFAFILFMAAWAVWDIDQLSGSAAGGTRRRARSGFTRPDLRRQLTLATAGPGQYLGAAGTLGAAGSLGGADAAGGADSLAAVLPAATAHRPSAGSGIAAAAAGPAGTATEPAAGMSVAPPAAARQLTDPRVAIACRIAMSVTMALMLVLMI